MQGDEKVTYVRFVFQGSALFEDDPKHYDVDASTQKYAELCRGALEQAYPDAEIEVFDTDVVGTLQTQILVLVEESDTLKSRESRVISKETTDFSWNSLDSWEAETEAVGYEAPEPAVRECPDEVAAVDTLCREIYRGDKWVKERSWLDTIQAHRRFNVPTAVIQWACREELIEEAEEIGGLWEFPLERFRESEIRKNDSLVDCKSALGIGIADDESYTFECYPEHALDVSCLSLFEDIDILLIAPKFFDIPVFGDDNSGVFVMRQDAQIEVAFERLRDDISWTKRWTYDTYVRVVRDQAARYEFVESRCEGKTQIRNLRIRFVYPVSQVETLHRLLDQTTETLVRIIQNTEHHLKEGGLTWNKAYEKDEILFCRQVLEPLLRRMGFDVNYTHGCEEHGRDFVLSEPTKFGTIRYYGLQAKAGNVRGGAKSLINEIFRQIEMGFEVPYFEPGNDSPKYISDFIVAISGHFTEPAKDEIIAKIKRFRTNIGSVHFWDQNKIRSLIVQCWKKD